MIVLLSALMLLSRAGWAADYSGTWILDLSASDSLEPLLQAPGVSLIQRKAAANMAVTQQITQTGDKLTFKVVTSANT